MKQQLLFVYNADSSWFSLATDFAHKILSPSTYQCHLCTLTYGKFSIKQEWKSFIESLPVEAVSLHKNEFARQYQTSSALPAVFISVNGVIQELISKDEIDHCLSLEELKKLVTEKWESHVQHHHPGI